MYKSLTDAKKRNNWAEPIHAIVDEGRSRSWSSMYHAWNVPNALRCPKLKRSARKAPNTVQKDDTGAGGRRIGPWVSAVIGLDSIPSSPVSPSDLVSECMSCFSRSMDIDVVSEVVEDMPDKYMRPMKSAQSGMRTYLYKAWLFSFC